MRALFLRAVHGNIMYFLEKNNFNCFYLKHSFFLDKMNLFDCYSL